MSTDDNKPTDESVSSTNDSKPQNHDGEVLVKDFGENDLGYGPEGKDFVFGGADHQLSSGIEVQHAIEDIHDEAVRCFDPEDLDDGEVVARIWINDDRELERVEWTRER